uniref:E3 ubiquitin-protein ligase UPL5 n=1 Tax=Solanum tuberosum TaxID=4113 RepID=M1C4R6_SOLTU
MAYQLPHETSTKRKFNDYAAASTARMRHNEILFNSSLKTPIQFFVRMFSGGKTLVIQAYSSDTVTSVHW